METPLVLRLLGRPGVAAGAVVELPTRKALALLAYLAVAGPAARSRIASLLWSDQDDEDARRNLRQELHRLHATPAGPWIDSHGEALALRPGADVDVDRFRQAAATGDDAEAVRLYRGELLDGLDLRGAAGFASWLAVERESLAAMWRASTARLAARCEAAGDIEGALDRVRALLAADPLQESQHRDAMRLLHLSGDRGGALAQFERCRELLRTQLGLEPMPETLALARRIRHPVDVAAAMAEGVPVGLQPPLIGRDCAWSQLEAAGRRLALVEGEAGLGKSRLMTEFASAHGKALVLKGREISRDTPFYPVAEALLQAYRDDPGWFELLDPVWRGEVARLVPALADDEVASGVPAPEARGRFLEGLALALLTATGDGSILFDDLHWFDGSSAELVAHVVRRAHRARLLAAARRDELATNASVRAALASIDRDGLLMRIPLAPLTESDVLVLVRALSGSTGATVFSRRLHAATDGNPLFIIESLRDLFSAGVLRREAGTWSTPYDEDTEDYRELPIPKSVREAVLRRIDRLGDGPRRLLEAASLAGDRFEVEWIGACTALSEWEVADALDRATEAQVVAAGANGYRFTHDLIRRSLDDALNVERRRLLHRRLAAALAHSAAPAAEIARHLESGGRPHEAIEHRVRAAEAAARVHALREAIAEYDAAIANGAAGAQAFRVHSARVELFRNLGDDGGRAAALDAMAAVGATMDDADLAAELAIKQSVNAFEHDRYVEALAIAQDARRALSGRIGELADASLRLEIGATLKALGRIGEAEEHLRIAIEQFEGNAPLKFANCAYWLCQCAIDRGDLATARSYCDTALRTTQHVGYRRGHALTLSTRAELAWRAGDAERAIADLEAAVREAREIGSLPLQRGFIDALVGWLRECGDAAAAARWQFERDALPS
ncbi:hypothetical protein BURK1_03176 [Burkholderiales bacterium]|nr:hypothetical protein BURK1_03176 [Burkholderiales bacterium]